VRSSSPEDDLFQVSDVDEDNNDVTREPETISSSASPPSPPTVILPLQTSSQKSKTTSRRTVRRLSAGSLKQAEADDEDACTDPPSSPLYGDGLLLSQQRGRKGRGAIKNILGRKSLPASAVSNTASTEESAAAITEDTADVELEAGSGRALQVAAASLKKKRGRPAKAKTEPIEGIQDKKTSGIGNFLSLLSVRVTYSLLGLF
jgi:hypothetical protein